MNASGPILRNASHDGPPCERHGFRGTLAGMLGIGWAELVVVVIIAIMVAGPKQIPDILYQAGRLMRRLRYLQHTVMARIDDHLDLEDVRRSSPSSPDVRTAIDDERDLDTPPKSPTGFG